MRHAAHEVALDEARRSRGSMRMEWVLLCCYCIVVVEQNRKKKDVWSAKATLRKKMNKTIIFRSSWTVDPNWLQVLGSDITISSSVCTAECLNQNQIVCNVNFSFSIPNALHALGFVEFASPFVPPWYMVIYGHGHPSLHLTHVTFSPDGHEVLLSYSGEHAYLMNVDQAGVNEMQYTSGDASKMMTYSPTINGIELQPCVSNVNPNGFPIRKNIAAKLDKCRKLIKYAKKLLDNGTPYYGIEACNEVLNGYSHIIGPALKHECFCTRAALLIKREWKNDAHMAIRDCYAARKIDNSSYKALYYMSEALSQLGKHEDALNFAVAAHSLAPLKSEVAERVENVKKDIALAEAEKNSKTNDGASRFDSQGGRILSLSDILYRPEANGDVPQDGTRSDRDDSDYDEELELDFETSLSGDEGHDLDSNILHGSLNLRIHRRGDSRDNAGASGPCESPSSSQNTRTCYQPEPAVDMKQRFIGHCNIGTDIKQANFLGQRGEYVASGSDDGRWFIWEKCTGRLIKVLNGDESVVNCIQCHPFDFVVATSGIDSTIKIWTPSAPVPSSVAGGSAGPETGDVLAAMESNQQKLSRSRTILPFELLEPFRMHEFPEGSLRLRPFECAQS
ncbi:unnamed protein product [Sphenostylis stenocarpa]|uniref:WD and tetratricopeptide repeats protein 1 n=1 Tax=Sphenostylis stenocarpa TaxID=92480 RepID=A0AA86TH86_9FABA|nr:unnamed protein product [Sphenostylis stenocarpa]